MELTSTNRSRAYPEGMGSKFWRKRLDSMFGFEGMGSYKWLKRSGKK